MTAKGKPYPLSLATKPRNFGRNQRRSRFPMDIRTGPGVGRRITSGCDAVCRRCSAFVVEGGPCPGANFAATRKFPADAGPAGVAQKPLCFLAVPWSLAAAEAAEGVSA